MSMFGKGIKAALKNADSQKQMNALIAEEMDKLKNKDLSSEKMAEARAEAKELKEEAIEARKGFGNRQVRKLKKVTKPASEGQESTDLGIRNTRTYGIGQVKAGAAALLTASAVAAMSLSQMRSRLEQEKRKAKEAKESEARAVAEKNRAILEKGIEKAVAEAMSSDSKKPTVKPKLRPQQKKRGGMIRTGHTDMRKGGLFYK